MEHTESKKILIHVRAMLKSMKKSENVRLLRQIKQLESLCREEGSSDDQKKRLAEKRGQLRGNMKEKFHQLEYCYPAIFNMVIDNDPEKFDMPKLVEMLQLRDKILAKRGEQERKEALDAASRYIGQKNFDQYVKPHVSESTEN